MEDRRTFWGRSKPSKNDAAAGQHPQIVEGRKIVENELRIPKSAVVVVPMFEPKVNG